jgi:hypothetical protein
VGVRGREEEVELFLVFLAIIGGFFFFCPLELASLRGGKKEVREREREREREKRKKRIWSAKWGWRARKDGL